MCVAVTQGPTASPPSLPLPGTVTIRLRLSTPAPTTATVRCRPGGGLSGGGSRTVSVADTADVAIPLQLSPNGGNGRGAHVITVEISEPGCADQLFAVGVTGT